MEKLLILKKFLTMQNYWHFKLFEFKNWLYFETIYILKSPQTSKKKKSQKPWYRKFSHICPIFVY